MNWKKLLALALSLSLVLSLAACDDQSGQDAGSSSPDASQSGEGSDIPEYVAAYTQALAGVDPDTVMFTVNGEPVTAEYYFYWLSYDCYYWDYMYQMYTGMGMDFDETSEDGVTNAEYLKGDAQQMACVYFLLEQQAAANNAGATDEQLADWEQIKQDYEEEYGAGSLESALRSQGLSLAAFNRINIMNNYLYDNLLEAVTHTPTLAEQDEYILEADILQAKHILIRTVIQNDDGTVAYYRGGTPTNADGSDYSGTADEFNAAALETVNSLLAQLESADDPIALFEELMYQYSEDPGLASYPDGYVFGAGEMHAEFEEGVRSLEYDAYSAEPVETADGYHIILRLRPDVTEDLRGEQMSDLLNSWLDAADIVTTDVYDALDVKEFYANYVAYQESMAAEENSGEDPAADPEDGEE